MTTWTARRLAWSVGIVSIALLLAALVLLFVDRGADLPSNVAVWSVSDVLDVLVSLGVPVLGIVIVNKRPKNAIGWIFIVAGIALLGASRCRSGLGAPDPGDHDRRAEEIFAALGAAPPLAPDGTAGGTGP